MSEGLFEQISNLQNNLGMLARGIHNGVVPNIEHQLHRVIECAKDIANEGGFKPKHWRNLHAPQQEVFIEPEAEHAFIKLQSTIALFITSAHLNDSVRMLHSLNHMEAYGAVIAKAYNINL